MYRPVKATDHLMKANFPNGTSTTNVTDALTGKSELMKASDHVAETINVALNVRIRIAFINLNVIYIKYRMREMK